LIKFSVKLVLTLIVLFGFVYFGVKYIIPRLEKNQAKENRVRQDTNFYIVTKVTDGDTFEVEMDGKREKVRMLGIDSPEKYESDKLDRDVERTKRDKKTIQKLGELSGEYVHKLLNGKRVRLEADPINDDKDKYGRLLRYVFLEDGTFVNKKIVEEGYANAFTKYPVSKRDEIVAAERFARENKKGLWGEVEGLNYLDEK
jgi:micrococcal nuclease